MLSFEEAILELKRQPAIYIIDEDSGMSAVEAYLGHFPCSWKGVDVLGVKYPWSMYMRKNSPYRDSINYG
jgi:hypothetical protein